MLRNVLSCQPKDQNSFSLINSIQLLEKVATEIDQRKIESDAEKKLKKLAETLEFQYLLSNIDPYPRLFLKEGSLLHQASEKKKHQYYYVFTG